MALRGNPLRLWRLLIRRLDLVVNTSSAVRFVFVMVILNDDLDYSTEATSSMVCRSSTIADGAIKVVKRLSNSIVSSRKLSVLIMCILSCKLHSSKRA